MARRSKATAQFRAEIDKLKPNRRKTSDGWIGDPAHAARTSDHNPNSNGVVQAEDITNDNGLAQLIWEHLLRSRDPRIKYVIFNKQMFSSYPVRGFSAWAVRPYTGINGHITHMHLSVQDSPRLYDDASPWGFLEKEDEMAKLSEEAQEFFQSMYDSRPKNTRPTSIWHVLIWFRKARNIWKNEVV